MLNMKTIITVKMNKMYLKNSKLKSCFKNMRLLGFIKFIDDVNTDLFLASSKKAKSIQNKQA